MKLPFEKLGASIRIANVFAGIAASVELQAHSTALKGGTNSADALAVGVVKALSNSNERGQTAG